MRTSGRPSIDVVDSTWLAVAPSVVADVIGDARNWAQWWPGLGLRVRELRGELGVQWFVDSVAGVTPTVAGTAEVWLESTCGATVAHFILRLDPAAGQTLPAAVVERVSTRYRLLTKRAFWALGDRVDPGRLTRLSSVPDAPPA